MKNRKSIFLLALGIAILAGVNLFLRMYGGDSARIVKRTTLAGPMETVTRLTIVRDARRMTLVKTARWRLVEPFAGSVDEQALARMMDALSFTPIHDSESDSDLLRLGRTRADFALEEPRLVVTFSGESGSNTVSFGSFTPNRDGVYAAIDGVESVYVMPTSVVASVDLPIDAFRRKSLFVIGTKSVEGFDVKRASAPRLSFVREGDLWKIDGQSASTERVRQTADGLLSASAIDFVWPVGTTNESASVSMSLLSVYGLDPETATTVTFKCRDGIDRQVSFGKNADEKTVYALVQNGGAIVTVPAALRDLALRERTAYTDTRLFPCESASVEAFTLSEGGVEFVLVRASEGVWRLESPVSAPADAAFVSDVLARILTLTAEDIREKGTVVTVKTNAAPVTVDRESILGKGRYEDLRSREILNIGGETVRRLVVTRGEQGSRPTAVVYGREQKKWSVESSERPVTVDEESVKAILAAVNPLKALQIVKMKVTASELDGYGLGRPHLTLAIDQDREDAVRRNVMIGAQTEGGRFATVGSADAVFVLPTDVAETLERSLVSEGEAEP